MVFEDLNRFIWAIGILPILLIVVVFFQWRKKRVRQFGDPSLFERMFRGYLPGRALTKAALPLMALALIAFSLPNLQKPDGKGTGSLTGLDVLIAMDVSNSMMARDIAPNRLERARLLASQLMDTLQGNRVGIIAFAGNAYLPLPLTTDLNAGRMMLSTISTNMVPSQGTNIYKALTLANESLNPAEKKYKAVILISDGEELDENAMNAAKMLKENGVVILSVGIGSPQGANIPTETGVMRVDDKGQTVVSRLNEQMLEQLANATYGSYYHLTETEETKNAILKELSGLEKKPITNLYMVNYYSYSYLFLGLALILLLIDWLLPIGNRSRKFNNQEPVSEGRGQTPAKKKERSLRNTVVTATFLLISSSSFGQDQKAQMKMAEEAYTAGNFEKAKEIYSSVLARDTGNAIAHYNLGNISYRQKDYASAMEHYNQAIAKGRQKTGQAWASNNKGLAQVQDKKLEEAIQSFKESLRKNPNDEEVKLNLNKAIKDLKQQQQKNQDKNKNQNQDQNQNKDNKSNMKQQQAEEKLNALREEEKRIRENDQKKKSQGNGGANNW